jgi:hypothetical protein
MPLGNLISAGKKIYDDAKRQKAADEPAFIPSMGKRNSMPTTSTRVSAREAMAAPVTKPAPRRRADPNDAGRVMESMGMGAGKAAKTLNQRNKKMLDDF